MPGRAARDSKVTRKLGHRPARSPRSPRPEDHAAAPDALPLVSFSRRIATFRNMPRWARRGRGEIIKGGFRLRPQNLETASRTRSSEVGTKLGVRRGEYFSRLGPGTLAYRERVSRSPFRSPSRPSAHEGLTRQCASTRLGCPRGGWPLAHRMASERSRALSESVRILDSRCFEYEVRCGEGAWGVGRE